MLKIRIGQKVIITKPDPITDSSNWATQMDIYDGLEFEIDNIENYISGQVHFKSLKDYPGLNNWIWIYIDGHFKILDKDKKIIKLNLKMGMKLD